MPRKYNRIIDDPVIEKPHYNNKSHYYDGFGADQGLQGVSLMLP